MPPLPIEPVLPDLRAALSARTAAVLQAPPGAGKTTLVPLALLEEPWLQGKKIVMLEPRRLAARAAATRMAWMVAHGAYPLSTNVERGKGGEEKRRGAGNSDAENGPGGTVGGLIGYRIRRDTKVSAATRIEVVTEGILTRILQHDPALEEYGLVIFDEFHERSLNGDLGLALTLQTQSLLRPDLRILVMSATLDGGPVASLLGDVPIVTSEGKAFPVETRWIPRRTDQRIEAAMASAIRTALDAHDGDLLAFLPGAAEIRRTQDILSATSLATHHSPSASPHSPPATHHSPLVDVIPLFGMLPQSEQDRALRPSVPGRRKVVLATSIAETSLTMEGIRVVVDSGLARVPKYSAASGMTRLATVRVSRASADQRRGRAGRTAPGLCYRLWAQPEELGLVPRATPEILEADLASFALDLAAQGIVDPLTLRWLDPPPAGVCARAGELLRELDAIDADGRITPHGREMATLPVHPRLAHMVLQAPDQGLGTQLAALLEERDILRGSGGPPDPDIELRVHALRDRDVGPNVDRETLHRVRAEAKALQELLDRSPSPRTWRGGGGVRKSADSGAGSPQATPTQREGQGVRRSADSGAGSPQETPTQREGQGVRKSADSGAGSPQATPTPSLSSLLALAYPDRIGKRRDGQRGRFTLRNGTGVWTDAPSFVNADWIIAAETDGDPRDAKLYLGAVLDEAEVLESFAHQITDDERVEWDPTRGAVVASRVRRLGAILIGEAPLRDPDPARIAGAMADAIRREGLSLLPWTDAAIETRRRLAFLHRLDPLWPDVSDAALLEGLDGWLGPALGTVRRKGDLERLDLGAALRTMLDWKRQKALDELAPTHVSVPSGSAVAVDYADPAAPVLAVKLQEVFGWTDTPRIGGGKTPLTLHLLSPARRPIQVTRDLASFWRNAYFEVRKDLRGRYPKHPWPEDPLTAEPTKRTKRRRPSS
ncbi:MAG TPA: ATP-dependent helicase C-terminal domain-containing protein [Gemmatimonadales bacterium]|nr:ATP-dependent helicase C-terminal domain-containing protein [Gemmatimonadales bacterium]